MTQDTLTKAATAAALIAAGKDSMANDVIGDITSRLTPEEVFAILDALSDRSDGAKELNLEMLAPYGLPYVPDIDWDDYSREGTVALIDRALALLRLDMANLAKGSEHHDWAVMRPYSANNDEWRSTTLFMEIGSDATIGIVGSESAIHGASFSIYYVSEQEAWETYVSCKLDVIVKHDGRVERFGEVREVYANWYADER